MIKLETSKLKKYIAGEKNLFTVMTRNTQHPVCVTCHIYHHTKAPVIYVTIQSHHRSFIVNIILERDTLHF